MSTSPDIGTLGPIWIYGWNSSTVDFITDEVFVFVSGNHIVFMQLEGNVYLNIFSCPGTGLQSFTTNKADSIFAYSELSTKPKIYLFHYERNHYPECEEICELSGGGELDIQGLSFSWEDQLACISGAPDFKITIWKWTTQELMCSIPVEKTILPFISFNPCNCQQLCSIQKFCLTLWDVYQYDVSFIMSPVNIYVPCTEVKKTPPKDPSYPGVTLPTFGFEPEDKYIGKFSEKTGDQYTQPTTHVWLPNGDILFGTEKGEIWKIDGEKHDLKLMWVDAEASKVVHGLPSDLFILSMILHRTCLYVGTKEGYLLKLSIGLAALKTLHFIRLPAGIIKLSFSLNCRNLIMGCSDGSIYHFITSRDKSFPVALFSSKTKMIAADFLPPWNKYIIALDNKNTVYTLKFEDRQVLSTLKLPLDCLCLTCSPMWYGCVVGTSVGVLFVLEYSKYPNPRIIHVCTLDKLPVLSIKFDNSGYIMYVEFPKRIFFLSGRPSANFTVFGYINLKGTIVDMNSWITKNGLINFVFITKNGREDLPGGTKFTQIQLPKNLLAGTARNMMTLEGTFQDSVVPVKNWITNNSCIGLGMDAIDNFFFSIIYTQKSILRFTLPDVPHTAAGSQAHDVPKIAFGMTYKSNHELADILMVTNPVTNQMVTFGNDGKLICRFMNKMDFTISTYADTFLGTIKQRKVIISKSGLHILIVTFNGDLLLYFWNTSKKPSEAVVPVNIRGSGHNPFKELPECTRENMAARLKSPYMIASLVKEEIHEDETLDLKTDLSVTSMRTKESLMSSFRGDIPSVEILQMPDFDAAWIDGRIAMKEKMDAEANAWERSAIKKSIKELGYEVAKLLVENDLLPETEQIPRQDFDPDWDMQKKMHEANKTELKKITEVTLQENKMNQYMWEVIKKECWDAMSIKGKSIKAFFKDITVLNFPLPTQSSKTLKKFESVKLQRQITFEHYKKYIKSGREKPAIWRYVYKEAELDEREEENTEIRKIHLGSQGLEYGGDSPYFYSQFELFSRDQLHKQIILLQDAIYRIKEQFNQEFDNAYHKKEIAIAKVRERNNRMQQIIDDIDLQITIWTPSWATEENPEECLVVHDSEIKSEKYYTPEERAKQALKKQEEDELRRRREADDFRLRALDKMMGGVLQVRREDEIFKKDIPPPLFLNVKPREQWTQDETNDYKEYEIKVKELNEEREKLRKQLEAEFHRSKANVQEIAESFDEYIEELFIKKLDTQMVVYQEELKLLHMNLLLAIEDDINRQHEYLISVLGSLTQKKELLGKEIVEVQKVLQKAHDSYDNIVVEDKLQDKYFKREFGDLPVLVYEALQKQFRKRPKILKPLQLHPCQTPIGSIENPYGGGPFGRKLIQQTNDIYIASLNEIDSVYFKPEGLSTELWEEFCQFRRGKIQIEYQIKKRASVSADVMAYLHCKQTANEKIAKEIAEVNDLITKMQQEKQRVLMNVDIQLIMKQGQVELECEGFLPNYKDAVLIHRNVVEEMNKHIRQLGAVKIEGMKETLKLENMIAMKEWEFQQKKMKIEDLINLAKEIQGLQVTREIKRYLQNKENPHLHAQQLLKLEETISYAIKTHELQRQATNKILERANKTAVMLKQKNINIDEELDQLNNIISRWKLIPKIDESLREISYKKFEDLSHRRELSELAHKQYLELLDLQEQMRIYVERSVPNFKK